MAKFLWLSLFTMILLGYVCSDCDLSTTGIYVSFSSEAKISPGRHVLRWIELHWWGLSEKEDMIGLWDHQPTVPNFDDALDYTNVTTVDGGYQTRVRWNSSNFPTDIESANGCLPLWGGVVRNGRFGPVECFQLRSNWMWDIKPYIESEGIANVLLPGSHDAGSYDGVRLAGGRQVSKWTITQDESLWQQFVLGARYVDMRVAYYENTTEKFWINHGDVRIRPLQGYLDDVGRFLNETREIIILDIHIFSHGYTDETSALLIDLLESTFKYIMAPNFLGPNPSLQALWDGGRLIVTYPHHHESMYLWPTVHHLWANTNDLGQLYLYMNTNIPLYSNTGIIFSCMTEFTPSALDVTLNRWGGLRGDANITNAPVTLWLRREWWNMANIVAMDFLGASGIVDVIIEANVVKHNCRPSVIQL